MTKPKPQIYVYLTEGGMADWDVTRGDIEVVFADWDEMRHGDYELTDLEAKRADLETIADPKIRERALDDINECIDDFIEFQQQTAQRAAEAEAKRLAAAERTLAEAGYTVTRGAADDLRSPGTTPEHA